MSPAQSALIIGAGSQHQEQLTSAVGFGRTPILDINYRKQGTSPYPQYGFDPTKYSQLKSPNLDNYDQVKASDYFHVLPDELKRRLITQALERRGNVYYSPAQVSMLRERGMLIAGDSTISLRLFKAAKEEGLKQIAIASTYGSDYENS